MWRAPDSVTNRKLGRTHIDSAGRIAKSFQPVNAQAPKDTLKYPEDLADRSDYPGMVRWFSPSVLVTTGRKAVVSGLFGQYADSRLIHASLDRVDECEITSRYDFVERLAPGPDDAVWIDYVADLGDGFDATYAIAYLLGQKTLAVDGVADPLPRGQALIMGGDQVYPEATRDNYKKRMLTPYKLAFPDSDSPNAVHPPVFLIPGNHDWYDGLVLFLGMFCTSREKKIGSWRGVQRRSYFAIKLPRNWWIWGFDSQLGEDIDQPQADYFVALAKTMPENPKIIICTAVPTWLRAELSEKSPEKREVFYRGLDYIAHIAKNECKKPIIRAVLSGDLHHYSRYSGLDAQFITAGGGGAFLHPTHQLPAGIDLVWTGKKQRLCLETEPGPGHAPTPGNPACYPKPDESRRLLRRNIFFPVTNFTFCVTMGTMYWIIALALSHGDIVPLHQSLDWWQWAAGILHAVFYSPLLWIAFLGLVGALSIYAAAWSWPRRIGLGALHAAAHLCVILALVSVLPAANSWIAEHTAPGRSLPGWFLPGTLSYFVLFAVEAVLLGGIAGGFIMGIYLWLTCARWGIHDNEAFSALRLGRYRHFLRLCLKDNELTIYPIGIDEPPPRSGWQWNPARSRGNQNEPEVIPKRPLKPCLIEGPIIISAAQ